MLGGRLKDDGEVPPDLPIKGVMTYEETPLFGMVASFRKLHDFKVGGSNSEYEYNKSECDSTAQP